MKWFSMFSGIGGFDLALTKLGHQVVGACEIDEHARSIYERHFPGTKIWEDATKIQPEVLPDFDGLCAGFPCQAFSIAGKRLGFEDSRGTLFFEIARIAKQKRPKILFLENVKGLLNHDGGKTFTVILNTLDELGYDAEWQVLNSKYWVPQNRERIFIIGHLRGSGSRQVFPIRDGDKINVETSRATQETRERLRGRYSRTIDAHYYKGGGSRTMIAWSKSERGTHTDTRIKEGEANTLTTGKGCQSQSSRTMVVEGERRIRMLTPKECERLQGFPDDWTSGLSDQNRFKCIGNAVTVPVIEFIAKFL